MAAVVIVEDGSIVAEANSYVTVDEANAYVANRELTLIGGSSAVGKLLIRACDYLQTFANEFKGEIVDPNQVLLWPRANVIIYGYDVPIDEIPRILKICQIEIATAIDAGFDPLRRFAREDITSKEKVGEIEVTYADPNKIGYEAKLPYANSLLQQLFKNSAGFSIETVRV